MSLEDFQLLDIETIDKSNIRSFSKVNHQQRHNQTTLIKTLNSFLEEMIIFTK